MFLHNHLFSNGLHNGSIGAVLEIPDEENILVVFPLAQGISFSIDESMFTTGQAYVALSHLPSWVHQILVHLMYLQMLVEYTRLNDIFDKGICEYRQRISGIHE
ncbi:hypothetical protein Glove_194g169 [Diversispora epigaea]|uniref:Uncharacterized protein n=1 Tax=Diversispora epigaea TaxID=1348612 RepID=A0A397IUV3_9GLOM|nr:hypothetical protein Glove_194g169 [Diversispora epigaea]